MGWALPHLRPPVAGAPDIECKIPKIKNSQKSVDLQWMYPFRSERKKQDTFMCATRFSYLVTLVHTR